MRPHRTDTGGRASGAFAEWRRKRYFMTVHGTYARPVYDDWRFLYQ